MLQGTVVGIKLSGPFKFLFDIIDVRVTFLDAKGPIEWACDKKREVFLHNLPLLSQKYVGGLAPLAHMNDAILIVSNEYYSCFSSL